MALTNGVVDQVIADNYALYLGDSCEVMTGIPDNSVHFSISSPPFVGLYRFSNSDRDVSNNDSDNFWKHYAVIIRETLRIMKPGRLCAVHVMQLPRTKGRDGYIGMQDFRGDVVRAFESEGWHFHSEVTIWKDPVIAQQRTKSIRLLHKQLTKDSAMSGHGLADYVVVFRKPGENDEAIAGMLDQWVGSDAREGTDGANDARTEYGIDVSREAYDKHCSTMAAGQKPWPFDQWVSVRIWQRYASPVWMDINQTRTLQYRAARDPDDLAHISPLQLDVIERCIQLWSNPGDVVFSPFGGVGSEPYCAVNMRRKGLSIELKESYWRQAVKNLAELEAEKKKEDIF
jgi:hypothetical protein